MKNNGVCFKLTNAKTFLKYYFQNITVFTNAQKIRKLEAINQKLSFGQTSFPCYENHYKLSL